MVASCDTLFRALCCAAIGFSVYDPWNSLGSGMFYLHSCDSVHLTSTIFRRGYFHTSPAVYLIPPCKSRILEHALPGHSRDRTLLASLYAPVRSIHLAVGRTQGLDKAILIVPPLLHCTPTPCSPAPASLTSTCRHIYAITHLDVACRFSCQVHGTYVFPAPHPSTHLPSHLLHILISILLLDVLPTLLRPPSYAMPIAALSFPSPSSPPPPPRVVSTTSAARPRAAADVGASCLSLAPRVEGGARQAGW
jgi:hypothetical protein